MQKLLNWDIDLTQISDKNQNKNTMIAQLSLKSYN